MASLIKPLLLKSGNLVTIVAPSGIVSESYVTKAVNVFESWGLKVKLGKNIFAEHFQFAGTDEQRLADLQQALDDNNNSAIICARGGYGAIRIADRISINRLAKKPKWVVGFSDATVLHSIIQNAGIQSVHALMPINFTDLSTDEKPIELLRQVLFEGKMEYNLPPFGLNKTGTERAVVTGGNLSLLYALSGTPYEIDTTGKILFIEDVGEQLYHLDRMLQSYRLAGKFSKLKGLIVGGLTEMEDKKRPFGKTAEEIVSSVVEGYNFPVIFNFPAGHQKDNCPLILGSETLLDVTPDSVKVRFD
jgi:muramoyltetrapeptide carboxypeptidase